MAEILFLWKWMKTKSGDQNLLGNSCKGHSHNSGADLIVSGCWGDLYGFLLWVLRAIAEVTTHSESELLRALQTYSKSSIHQSELRIAIPQDFYSAVCRAGGEFEGKEISYFYCTKWFMPRLLLGSFFPSCKDHFPLTSPHNGDYFKRCLINTEWLDSLFCNSDGCSLKFSLSQFPLHPLFNLWVEFPPQNGAPLSFWLWDESVANAFCRFSSFKWNSISLTPSNRSQWQQY